MPSLLDYDNNCFFCRVLRSFAITGAGAGVAGFGALYMGVPRNEAVYWALAGGLALMAFVAARSAHRKRGGHEG